MHDEQGTIAADADALAARLARVRERIAAAAARSGRPAAAITLLAVTKNVAAEGVRAAYAAGMRDFGENRVQEALRKIPELHLPDARWELIGHLQTNKVREAAPLFARIQSVDSLRLMERLDAQSAALGRRLPVLLEVNAGEEASKLGIRPGEALDAARALAGFAHLAPQGLMTVAPIGNEEVVRPVFRQMRELRDMLRRAVPLSGDGEDDNAGAGDGGWDVLSMGMSDDYELAIEEGTTLVRIGRVLFGPRPAPAARASAEAAPAESEEGAADEGG
jgi:PLP dependent protein